MAELGFLVFLKSYYGPKGIIPSAETLATDAGITTKTVWLYLRTLEKKRLIKRTPRGVAGRRTSNSYTIDDEIVADLLIRNQLSNAGAKKGLLTYCGQNGPGTTLEDNKGKLGSFEDGESIERANAELASNPDCFVSDEELMEFQLSLPSTGVSAADER